MMLCRRSARGGRRTGTAALMVRGLLSRLLAPHFGGGVLDGAHDVVIAGAAAEIALQVVPDLLFRRVRVAAEHAHRSHNHARGTVATLQAVALPEALLHRVQ